MKTLSDFIKTKKLQKKFLLVVLLVVFSSLTSFGQLSGTYTIGVSQDYTDIASAISDLHADGIDGPVVFNIIPGTYTVHVTMNQIVGASETNTITFQSSTQDSSAVILQYEAVGNDDNWIFLLDGPDHLNFNHLTFKAWGESIYGIIILFDGFTSNVSFNNNAFLGKYSGGGATARETIVSATVSYNDQSFSNLHFTNNYFYRGSYAMHFQGPNDTYQSGVLVNNNIFEETGYCCTYCNYCYAPQINYNTMEAISYGIRVNGDYGGGTYSFNKIYSDHQGMSIQRFGPNGGRALISNNFVTIGPTGTKGISISNSVYTDVLNNSVYLLSNSWAASAFHSASAVNTVPTVTVKNNNFSCEYSSYVLEVLTENVIGEMSNNNFYTAGNYIANWAYTKVFDIRELQDLTGMNANSLSVYPHFVSDRDLHTTAPWLNNKGAFTALVSMDIDGESRSMSPDIGADEFSPDPASMIQLDGSMEYTIGSGGTYADFETAMADALLRGVSAPIIFGFLDGTFNGPFTIKSIPGSNDNNRINIQSATANSERAELVHTALGNDDNFVFRFHGADFINLKNLKLSAKDDYYAQVIDLYQGADSVLIENNIITTASNTNAVVRISHIFSGDSDFRSRIIQNNQFEGAAYSIYMRRDQNNFLYPTGAVIEGNSFSNVGYSAMYLQFYDSPKIIGNTIGSNYKGIQALSCSKDLRIQKNKIDMVNGDAIYLSTCAGTEENKGLISNNFIHIAGTSARDGIYINNSPNQLVLNNSINISNTNIGSRPLYISSGGSTSVSLYNNIFSNKGGGSAMYIYYPSTVLACNYNAYYSMHDFMAYWGENVTNLEALQTLNLMDEHSVFGNPHFVSDTDLHTSEEILDGAAQSFAAVPDDIDGDQRDLVKPDIGADEFGAINLDEFTLLESELQGLSHGSIKWGDYDNDGDLDLLQTGWTGTLFEFKTKIINNTEEGFVDSGIALVGLSSGTSSSASWFDFDNDNDLDVIITGRLDGNALTKKTLIYENNSGAFTLRGDLIIQNISSSSVASADMNHDGKYDLLIMGSGESGNMSSLYLNNGISFTEVSIGLTASFEGEIYPLDIDNDGDMDVFICGAGIDPSVVFINQEGIFTSKATEIPGVVNSSADWADIDEDGDLDVAIMGIHDDEILLQIYINNGMEKADWFSLLGSYTGMESGDLAFVDYDNDGDMDLSVTGNRSGFQPTTKILRNDEGIFSEINYWLADLGRSSLDWGDFDKDGDLDLAIQGTTGLGPITAIYRNDRDETNTSPTVPDQLEWSLDGYFLNLSWNASTDDLTPSESIAYNLRVGTTSQGSDILSPSSENSFLKKPFMGNAGNKISLQLTDLEPGNYYWSVQAVDQNYMASDFSTEEIAINTGIFDLSVDSGIGVYPNPTRDKVWIRAKESGLYQLKIHELSGREVLNKEFVIDGSVQQEILLEDLKAGVYIISIKAGDIMQHIKLVIH